MTIRKTPVSRSFFTDIELNFFIVVFLFMNFRLFLLLVAFLTINICVQAQPGPDITHLILNRLDDSLQKNPDNDKLRLERIGLIDQKSDIDYLFEKLEKGTKNAQYDSAMLYSMYGDAFQYAYPDSAVKYYRKSADLKTSKEVYTQLFIGYCNLRNVDTAKLYFDTIFQNYGFSEFDDRLHLLMIETLRSSPNYEPSVPGLYNWLSYQYFERYREVYNSGNFEPKYSKQILLETGFRYQYELCDYYLKYQKFDEVKRILENLKPSIGRNSFGEPVELHVYGRYYFLLGTVQLWDGKEKEAAQNFLIATDYPHFKDTSWSAELMRNYPQNPSFMVLHAQVMYNQQKMDRWQTKHPDMEILGLFEKAKKRGSKNYKIYLALSNHFLVVGDYTKSLEQVELAIENSQNLAISYGEKTRVLKETYWHDSISKNEVEALLKVSAEQEKARFSNVVTHIPTIKL